MKDNFSKQSNEYARFRPLYPDELYQYIFQQVNNFDRAWDCATGNGQIAQKLAERFIEVEATDISENQLNNAKAVSNICYSRQSAENPEFPENYFDLIVVGQAAHWFDLDRFYTQVNRVLRPGGFLLLTGYTLVEFEEPELNSLVHYLYETILGNYWDPERRIVEQEYRNIPFPFQESTFPRMYMRSEWTREQLLGFFSTWSALQHYIQDNGENPVDSSFVSRLHKAWPDQSPKPVRFPVFGRAGKK